MDGDGTPDVLFDGRWSEDVHVDLDATLVSGATLRSAGTIVLPGVWAEWGSVVALGDLDGDGFDDLGTTASNFVVGSNLLDAVKAGTIDLRGLDVEQLWEGRGGATDTVEQEGCVWVYSGRTRDVMWVLLGRPGMREELGRGLCSVPDVSGDGWPDLVVSGREATYVLAGPGRGQR